MILQKNESVAVAKDDGRPVINLTVGAAWGKINALGTSKPAGFFSKVFGAVGMEETVLESVDLDLSLLFFSKKIGFLDKCYFGNRSLWNGVQHSGDNLEGSDVVDAGKDNERISIKGMTVPSQVDTIFLVLNSFRHHKFDKLPYIGVSIYDGLYGLKDKADRLMEFRIDNDKSFAGVESAIMARLDRTPKGFVLTSIGKPTKDTSLSGLIGSCGAELNNI